MLAAAPVRRKPSSLGHPLAKTNSAWVMRVSCSVVEGFTDETGENLYHWLDDALAFVVYPAGEERGVVRLEGRWAGEEIGVQTEKVAT